MEVNIKLSLREARVLLRAVGASGRLVYDPRIIDTKDQSEAYRALLNVELAVGDALAESTKKRFNNYAPGFAIRYRWVDEPLSAPFGSVFKNRRAV